METKVETKKKAKAGVALLVSLCVLVVCFGIIWGINTSFGKVKVDRVFIPVQDGEIISGLLYVPEEASMENKLPAALVLHGGNDNAQTFASYCIELSRRGFICLAIDENASAYSDYDEDLDNYEVSLELALWLKTLDFVNPDKVIATGHSMGGIYAPYACTYADLAGAIPVNSNRISHELVGNYAFIYGIGDTANLWSDKNADFLTNAFGSPEMPEAGKLFGSIEENNARIFIWEDGNTVHTAATWNSSVIEHVCHWALAFTYTTSELADTDQVYKITYWASIVGMFAITAFAINLMLWLMQMPAFSSIKRPLGPYMGYTGKDWAISAAITMLPSVPLFILIYKYIGNKLSKLYISWLPVGTFNKFIPFLIAMSIWDTLTFILLFHRKKKAEGIGTAWNYGFTWGDNKKQNIINIAKCLGLATIVSVVVFSVLNLMDRELGVGFKFYFAGLRAPTFERVIPTSLPYILLMFLVYVGAQFGSNIVRRLPSTGHDCRDLVRDVIVNSLVAGLLLTLYFVVQVILANNEIYITVTNHHFYGYAVMIWLSQMVNTVMYRKTGSIWPGLMLMSVLFGVLLNANYPVTSIFPVR